MSDDASDLKSYCRTRVGFLNASRFELLGGPRAVGAHDLGGSGDETLNRTLREFRQAV